MKINPLGREIRELRKQSGQTILEAAKGLKIGRSYLNKVELGTHKPSKELLERILAHFSVEGSKAYQLRNLAGYIAGQKAVTGQTGGRKEEGSVMDKQSAQQPVSTQVNIDPVKSPVLYTDSIIVSSSEYGLVLNIAQQLDGGHQQVVSRVGMSYDHAKKLLAVMNDHLQKYER